MLAFELFENNIDFWKKFIDKKQPISKTPATSFSKYQKSDFIITKPDNTDKTYDCIVIFVGTSYAFKVQGQNNVASGPYTTFTNSVTIGGWKLAQTYNSSTNYTVPADVTQIGVVVINGGNGGGGAGGGGGYGNVYDASYRLYGIAGNGGDGAVRIIWGSGRSYPSNAANV